MGQVDARYNVAANNDLYGMQLGARWREHRNRLGLEAFGKAGLYYNVASEHHAAVEQIPSNPFPYPSSTNSVGDVAFLGELGLALLYEISPALTLRAGYSVLWLEGVALAPDQLDYGFPPEAGEQIDSAGGVFYHGASIGLEFRH